MTGNAESLHSMLVYASRSVSIASDRLPEAEQQMAGRLSRAEVAERIGVKPTTIYRWEKRRISPVTPLRHQRTKQLIYTEEDVKKLQAFKNETAPATIGREPAASSDGHEQTAPATIGREL
jgi:DNA-binding XRE family transcriptional regulator